MEIFIIYIFEKHMPTTYKIFYNKTYVAICDDLNKNYRSPPRCRLHFHSLWAAYVDIRAKIEVYLAENNLQS